MHSARVIPRVFSRFAVLALVGLSCDSPTEPRNDNGRILLDRIVEGQSVRDSMPTYALGVTARSVYALYVEVARGSAYVSVLDSVSGGMIAREYVTSSSPPLEENPLLFEARASGAYLLTFYAPDTSGVQFRFVVRDVGAPEARSADVQVGEVVDGESIDRTGDVDLFLLHGPPGSMVVAVAQGLTAPDSSQVSLVAATDPDGVIVGYTLAVARAPARSTTGRMRFPDSGRLRVGLASARVIDNGVQMPAYRGPYRFWTYAVDSAPERAGAALAPGTEVRGESIDRAGDVDEFRFNAAAGAEFNAFLQASRPFVLEVGPAPGPPAGSVTSVASDTTLFAHGTGRFRAEQAGAWVARVSGLDPGYLVADTGGYRLLLYPIDRRPETMAAVLPVDDTVAGEAIDRPGDVDEFPFTAVAGEEFNAFLQALDGSAGTALTLEAVDAGGPVVRTVQSVGSDTSLWGQLTGRFTVRQSGTQRLRIRGAGPYDTGTGPYRVLLHLVDRRPESHAPALAVGDTVRGEAVEIPGDVDEFRVTVGESTGVNLEVELSADASGGQLYARFLEQETGRVMVTATALPGGRGQTGGIALGPRAYTVRVHGSQWEEEPPQASALRGSYRLWLDRFGFGPETARDTIAIGDTVEGEAIEPLGDWDRFVFHGVRGQHIVLALQGLAPAGDGVQADLYPPPGESAMLMAVLSSPSAAPTLTDYRTQRVDLRVTGWYALKVTGSGWSDPFRARGPYRLAVMPMGVAPEHVGEALTTGDSVSGEGFDFAGDWDEFTLTGTPGQMLRVLFQTDAQGVPPRVDVTDAETGDSVTGTASAMGGPGLTAPFRVPPGGRLKLAVYQPPTYGLLQCWLGQCSGGYGYAGTYRMLVMPFDSGPEILPATYVVGDTARGEAIFPVGDVDEFSAGATPGDTLVPSYRLAGAPTPPGTVFTLEIVDPGTGSSLAGENTGLTLPTPDFYMPGEFVVPASGRFLVRVKGLGLWQEGMGTAPYEFVVRRR